MGGAWACCHHRVGKPWDICLHCDPVLSEKAHNFVNVPKGLVEETGQGPLILSYINAKVQFQNQHAIKLWNQTSQDAIKVKKAWFNNASINKNIQTIAVNPIKTLEVILNSCYVHSGCIYTCPDCIVSASTVQSQQCIGCFWPYYAIAMSYWDVVHCYCTVAATSQLVSTDATST